MKEELKDWNALYEAIQTIMETKPWENLWDNEFICLELAPNDLVYCSIMGRNKDCIGISFYEGEQGFLDLCSANGNYKSQEVIKYIMYEQTCFTWYLGERSEVPKAQLDIIKELKLKYKANAMPYFIRMQAQYFPRSITTQEVKRMNQIMECLLPTLAAFHNNNINVDFEHKEMIYTHKIDNVWIYEAKELPEFSSKFYPIELQDQGIFQKILSQKPTNTRLYLEMNYLNSSIDEEQFEHPANALMFIVIDANSQKILHGELVSPGQDEIEIVLSFFIEYMLNNGSPKEIYVRNPMILSALFDICKRCNIEIKDRDMALVDQILNEVKNMILHNTDAFKH